MNNLFKSIQKSFDLLDRKKNWDGKGGQPTKKSSFMKALEYLLKIAKDFENELPDCSIDTDRKGDIIATFRAKDAELSIEANQNGISFTGKGPHKDDAIRTINSESYYVSSQVTEWLKRNNK